MLLEVLSACESKVAALLGEHHHASKSPPDVKHEERRRQSDDVATAATSEGGVDGGGKSVPPRLYFGDNRVEAREGDGSGSTTRGKRGPSRWRRILNSIHSQDH